ncbi:glycine receptor subunit alpha-2-like [Lineus longissimus]|uniref:glycine receptor subunit alpha-2-like n=1 Tax=Lineus longissimus TaxID=88925 RepID=UPI002B4FA0ED
MASPVPHHVLFASLILVSLAAGEETPTTVLQTLLRSYDGNLRPKFRREPVTVLVDYYIQQLFQMDEEAQDLSLTMYFRLLWRDPRLKFQGQQFSSINVPTSSINLIWKPDLFFPRAKSVEKETEPVGHEMLRLSSVGDILYSRRLLVKVPCDINYRGFPWDSFNCTVDIESYASAKEDLVIEWKGDAKIVKSAAGLQRFSIANITHQSMTQSLSTGNYQRLLLTISLTRSAGHYVTQFYLPWVFLVIFSNLALWIHRRALFARFMVLLSVVIATAAHSIGNRLNYKPPTDYVTPLDVYGAVCYILIFLAMAETAAVAVIEKQKPQKNEPNMLPLESTSMQPSDADDSKPLHVQGRRAPSFLAHVDVVTRISFIIVFSLFNLIYWLACTL